MVTKTHKVRIQCIKKTRNYNKNDNALKKYIKKMGCVPMNHAIQN